MKINEEKQMEKGITLVALIITIIILIILAAVTIFAFRDSKLIEVAINGTVNYANAQAVEESIFNGLAVVIDDAIEKIEAQGKNNEEGDVNTPNNPLGGAWEISPYGEPIHGEISTTPEGYLVISGLYCYLGNFMVTKGDLVDLTGYSSLNVTVDVLGTSGSASKWRNCGIALLDINGNIINKYNTYIRPQFQYDLGKGKETFSVDLTGLTDTQTYIAIHSNSYTIQVYDIWLE